LALEGARDWVALYLGEQNPPLQWRPDAEYLQQNKMVTFSDPETVRMGEKGHEEEFQQVTVTVEVTNKTFNDIQEQDRKLRAEQRKLVSKDRQTFLAKILAGVVATLAAVAIYLVSMTRPKGTTASGCASARWPWSPPSAPARGCCSNRHSSLRSSSASLRLGAKLFLRFLGKTTAFPLHKAVAGV
jgi:hypothetical protein